MEQTTANEFNILGVNVTLIDLTEEEIALGKSVSPREVIEFVGQHIDSLKKDNHHLNDHQLGVLLALQMAKRYMTLQKVYTANIDQLRTEAEEALSLVQKSLSVNGSESNISI